MTTYHIDFERRAEEVGAEEMAADLAASGHASLTDGYNAIVDFFTTAQFGDFPRLIAPLLYRQPAGRVTDYRAQVVGHYVDGRGRFTVLIANGDRVVIIKPREGEV
ncbi:hypothetical protein SEA_WILLIAMBOONE_136 [Gordonia phage WilliamBoone]|nr:hypothetical protein SEA_WILLIAMBOONE_136 [Gordonia phage WilliamBoone]